MDKGKIIGLLLISAGIILNQLKLENDFADFFMGVFIAIGLVLIVKGLFKRKANE